jgi:hypothetical protein
LIYEVRKAPGSRSAPIPGESREELGALRFDVFFAFSALSAVEG